MSEVFEDVTDLFLAACQKMKYQEIAAMPEFSYLESMSAVELMDIRLDSGLALLKQAWPEVQEEFSDDVIIALIDMFLLHFAQWLEGQSLPHTFYSSVFLHNKSENIFIEALCQSSIYLSSQLHQLIHSTGCLREDDYAYSTLQFPEFKADDPIPVLLKSEKLTANKEILARLKFIRGICTVIANITSPDGIPGAESNLAFAQKQFSQIEERQNPDVSHWFDKNFCLSRIPHFLPNKIYEVQKYTFSRGLKRISAFLESIKYIIELKDLTDFDEIVEKISSLPSFDNFSRTICEFLVFPPGSSLLKYFNRVTLVDLILKNMQLAGVDIPFLNLNEEFSYFLSRVEIVFKECILLKLKNKTRQQRLLAKYLSDFNILVSEAHFLVEKIYGKNTQKPEKLLLFQWIFQKTTKIMIEYLKLGFELELYTDKDVGMVMFYIDFLLGVYINNLNTLLNYLNSKLYKKKKIKVDIKRLENELKHLTGIQFLCRGIVRFFILLKKFSGVTDNDDNERIRYNKRFRMFRNVQIPQFIEYNAYQGIKNFEFSLEEFANACKECFDLARSNLNENEGQKNVKGLLRVCVKNSLALSKAKKMDMKCKVSFEYVEDKVFPVFLIE